MGENTNIAWCDHTFSQWLGCMKVSAACDHCYAETLMDTRYHRVEWGQRKTETTQPSVGTRVLTSESNRKLPYRWARKARERLEDFDIGMLTMRPHRPRVFCSSLSDVFDNQVPPQWRIDLFNTIAATPELDWLLLTKRPENFDRFFPVGPWQNVWLGVTAEDQENYDRRWKLLRRQRNVAVRFISYEPALGDIWLDGDDVQPDWIICGGETGPGYREMKTSWAAHMAIQCEFLGIALFMKQMAGRKPIPDELMIREFPREHV